MVPLACWLQELVCPIGVSKRTSEVRVLPHVDHSRPFAWPASLHELLEHSQVLSMLVSAIARLLVEYSFVLFSITIAGVSIG